MPSMMAIVSKAVFERDARGTAIGDIWPTDRYVSQNKGLAQLAGGDLYLVTVRPPDEALWLVAILEKPQFDKAQWSADDNATPIRDISNLKSRLKFANGQGLPSKAGALGMSLQTPRVLVEDDVELLVAAADMETTRGRTVAKAGSTSNAAKAGPTSNAAKAAASKSVAPKSNPVGSKSVAPVAPNSNPVASKSVAPISMSVDGGAAFLEQLLDTWADDSHPRLAELIVAASNEVRTPTPANVRGKTAVARAAWDELAETASAVDLPALLESLCDVTSGDAARRLDVVDQWMPDPRVDAAFVQVLIDVPFRATSTKPFWTKLFGLATEMRDPAQIARLEKLEFAHVAATMAEWLAVKTAKLVAQLKPRMEVAQGARPDLDAIAAAIGKSQREAAGEREELATLFTSVYEAPHDDGPRVVLADALIERGDPRGELINVQLRLVHEPNERALKVREKELLDAHGKGWLGELAPVLAAGFRFERGFLAACVVDNEHFDRVQKLVGNPAWSTVHTLSGSAAIGLHPVMRSLRRLGFDQWNARRHEEMPNAWRDLLIETTRPIEELTYGGIHGEQQWLDTVEGRRTAMVSDQSEVDALCACAALPELKRLTLRDDPVRHIYKIATAPVLERLEVLGFVYDRNNRFDAQRASPLVDFAKLLVEARVPTLRFEIGHYHETELELERGARGYERARLVVGPTMKSNWSHQLVDEAIRMLDSLPKTMRELHVTARKWTEPQQLSRLRAAASQLQLDVYDVSGRA
jgi:uncharacterized protein (TIGR02996 family)